MKPFLTAEWRNLILITYEVEASLLEKYLPKGLQLDQYKGRTFASFVAFDFLNTKVRGLKIPFHINFPEVNLRFYVRRTTPEGYKRGVVFIREWVPKHCIAWVANRLYNEPYKRANMASKTLIDEQQQLNIQHFLKYKSIEHQWRFKVENAPYYPDEYSTEHFFKEHEWGFGTTKKGALIEYKVEHPKWRIYPLKTRFYLDIDFAQLYGEEWEFLNGQIPYNLLVAEGSAVKVFPGKKID